VTIGSDHVHAAWLPRPASIIDGVAVTHGIHRIRPNPKLHCLTETTGTTETAKSKFALNH
jgi:hypothetical protein